MPIRTRRHQRDRRRAGGSAGGQVPHHTLSLWNTYQVNPRLGAGLGIIHRTDMFAAIDNTVVLPGYTRVDVAVYLLHRSFACRPTSRTCSTGSTS